MNRTETVQANIQPELKANAEAIFQKLGITSSQAISLFYQQVELHNGLPFDPAVPNQTTLETFAKTDAECDLVVCENTEDLFAKLGI